MEVPQSVLQAAVGLALEHGRIERDPARRNSLEWQESIERRQAFARYVHEHGYDTRLIANHTARIPQEAYGPIPPEMPFVVARPPEDQIRRIAAPLLAEPPLAEVVALRPQPTELPAALPEEQVA